MIDTQGKLLIAPPNMPDPRFARPIYFHKQLTSSNHYAQSELLYI